MRTLIAVALAAFTLSASAWAADVFGEKITIARAIFERVDGCIVSGVTVLIVDERESSPPGRPVQGAWIEAAIDRFDQCSGETVSFAFAIEALTDEEFHIDKKLESASVTKTVEMIDEAAGTSFEVSIDLTLTAIGPASRDRLRFFNRSPDGMSHSTEKVTFVDATASGSVVSGTTDLLETLTPALVDIFTRSERGVAVIRK